LRVSEIAFEAFFDDTKQLVAQGVRADIAHRIATASSRENLSIASSRGVLRESSLATWLKFKHPLYYGHRDGQEVFTALLLAVSSDDIAVSGGLPNWEVFSTSPSALASNLFDMSSPRTTFKPKAPVVRNGSFLPVLKVVHRRLLDISNRPDQDGKNAFALEVLKRSLMIFKIKFYPEALPKTGAPGAPPTKPVFDSWGNIGHADRGLVYFNKSTPAPSVPPAMVAFNNAIANDCNADWSSKSLDLVSIKRVLQKRSLPIDFGSPRSGTRYVEDTYGWVRDHYDGTKPLHHLALLVAIVVSSSLLPHLFMPVGKRELFKHAGTEQEVRRVYDHMEWTTKAKKGMRDRSIFVAMFTTLIISLYEESSPLRVQMSANSKNGLGNGWTTKHSEHLFLSPSRPHPFFPQP
jgi:hypothetical protein